MTATMKSKRLLTNFPKFKALGLMMPFGSLSKSFSELIAQIIRFRRKFLTRSMPKRNEIIEATKKFAASAVEDETQKALSNLSDSLMKISQDFLNQQRKRAWIYDFFVPVACTCLGIFFLCLISFVGGAAVAGKGWGHSPVEALLNAPAGWIIPLALIPVCGVALFRGLTEQGKSRLINLMTALIMAILFLCVLIHIL